ncbi:MAG TPA: SMI1/KNR4 family protein [Archangium sp.]|uniref:SMI1/KNR4 family protein n=1 Tax=Archangium sp. TaxID=1872627 RepID=UPI002E377DD2|nr:SMI1/KNR4 family protein [Archangium sp.]HEX5748980.1 SMI1/KNR4 family protein [Archangium sp.]
MRSPTQLPELEVLGAQRFTVSDALLDTASEALGLRLPASYREFAKRYGFGAVSGMFVVHVPVPAGATPGCAGLLEVSRQLSGELAEMDASQPLNVHPDGTQELVRRLVPFGESVNGDVVAWDPAAPSGGGELWLYLVSMRAGGVYRAAPNLAVFLAKTLEPGLGGMLERMQTHLPATFSPHSFETV